MTTPGNLAETLATVREKPGKPTERKKKEVGRLLKAERDLTAEFLSRAQKLEALVPNVGDALLDAYLAPEVDSQEAIAGEGAGRHEIIGSVARARAELEGLESSINAARRQRAAAVRDLYGAQAADMRREAARLTAEADKRQERTDKLLAELLAFEGAPYRAVQPKEPIPGTLNLDYGGPGRRFAIPRTQWIRNLATDLETQAVGLESQEANRSSSVAVFTLDDLIAALYADAESIAPRELDVRPWAAPLETKAWSKGQRYLFANTHAKYPPSGVFLTYQLTWTDSEIVNAQSSITLTEVSDRRPAPPEARKFVRTMKDLE